MSATIIPFPVPKRPASEWKIDAPDERPITAGRAELQRMIAERYGAEKTQAERDNQ